MTDRKPLDPHLILPVGTHVVLRDAATRGGAVLAPAGAVGEVVGAPADHSHAYRVRLPDGTVLSLRRPQVSIRKHVQRADPAGADRILDDYDLREHVVFRCVVGSRAYGLATDASDVDRRGIYLPPAELHWSLYGVPEQLESRETEECYWEMQKFVSLALKANPGILECLYTPLVETVTPVAEELLSMRASFLSRLVHQTYGGYVMSQFKKLEQDLRTLGAPKWKHAMHLLRLLISGATVLREGHVPVRMEEHRERLLAVKRGEMPWDEVNAWRLELHRRFDRALESTRLPERPDHARANAFLVRARRSAVNA